MEFLSGFGMREWLISCGVVLVLVVLFDGYRRMRNERRGEIKMALRMGGGFPEVPEEQLNSELPNGGARVICREEPTFNDNHADEVIDETLADPIIPSSQTNNDAEEQFHESLAELTNHDSNTTAFDIDRQILVIHAKSQNEHGFNGSDLLQILLACDMRYGDRDILHRHERAGGNGSLQFSVANMIEPGTFNLEDINSFRTPGITFFMTLPGPEEPEQAFECMLETANCLVKNLGADLLDDNHDAMTPALISSYKERIQNFTRHAQSTESI